MNKSGIGFKIAAGSKTPPPRYKAIPDAPEESPRPAPSEKGGDPAPPMDTRPEQDTAMHEAVEAPVVDADMMSGVMAPLIEAGASESEAKAILGKMFSAMAKCMGGGMPMEHEGMEMEGGE
jgi:hypothetical protein